MNAHTLSKHYAQLTAEERLRLILAAQARGDQAELVSLGTSCPTMEVIAPNPTFSRLILGGTRRSPLPDPPVARALALRGS